MKAYALRAIVTTPMGGLTLVASGEALIGVYFPRHWTKPDAPAFGARGVNRVAA